MQKEEKFQDIKRDKLTENERNFGEEVRGKYGDDLVESANKKFMGLSQEDFTIMEDREEEMLELLKEVIKSKDLNSKAAEEVYKKHKLWLSFTWPSYSPQAHRALAQMYQDDERFSRYYNERGGKDGASTLKDIILAYAK